MILDERVDSQVLTDTCGCVVPTESHRELLDCVATCFPGLSFRALQIDDEWYRVGGVVDADGRRIADSLDEWAERESGGDAMELLARHGDAGYFATAIRGRTHYLVAPSGMGPLEFVQVEVDEVQEVVERPLFDPVRLPDTIEDVIDPLDYPRIEPRPLGPARYVFRDVTHWANRLGELTSEFTGDLRFKRFLEEWDHSSAGRSARFSDHWVLTVVPYLDQLGDHKQEVRPLTPDARLARNMAHRPIGPRLADSVRAIDHQAGYDMAWYFLMLTRNYLPYASVKALYHAFAGNGGGVAYLPGRDLEILARWVDDPYHLQPFGPVPTFRAA